MDVAGVDIGSGESLVGTGTFPRVFGVRRLAADCFAVDWGVNLWILLGDVEFLFVAEMGLSHARDAVSAYFRNAADRLWRLRAICAGVV